jgi:hypothetical protein
MDMKCLTADGQDGRRWMLISETYDEFMIHQLDEKIDRNPILYLRESAVPFFEGWNGLQFPH